jgi:hypothetical protein
MTMPIEIRELVIRAVAEVAPEARRAAAPATTRGEPSPSPAIDEALVARCVREVLRELRRSQVR